MAQSTFLSPGSHSQTNSLAILHLRRDHSIPTILCSDDARANEKGYAEGIVTNTRFGSFPHSTLADVPWGSQVLASKVDTGSRGRQPRSDPQIGSKRKLDVMKDNEGINDSPKSPGKDSKDFEAKQAVPANSGFIHVLPPTPENWTTSLPHRTQVVYTPDYSYILHRIRARPGSVLIEAGSGSGSFTHAAARAVFSGYAESAHRKQAMVEGKRDNSNARKRRKYGHVFTYEFNSERHEKIVKEMNDHGLNDIVTVTHRDVYNDGFLLSSSTDRNLEQSPSANTIFLDLPAPWQALPHLSRRNDSKTPSPLDPDKTVHICTFSPCIEQAQRTISALRLHDWLEIEMVEIAHKRLEVRREHTGLQYEGMRNVNAVAGDVNQAVAKLREVEKRQRVFHHGPQEQQCDHDKELLMSEDLHNGNAKLDESQLWKEGRLIHRTEPDLKSHTSYLVFALLPRQWTEQDELQARQRWTDQTPTEKPIKSKRQTRREASRNGAVAGPSKASAEDTILDGMKSTTND